MPDAGPPRPSRRRSAAGRGVLAGIALAAACTRVSETQRFPPSAERLSIARTIPEPDGTIPADGQVDFCFSGYVDPRALDDFAATVSSGTVRFDAQLDLQLFAWRPPGGATGTSNTAWCDGSVLSIRPGTPFKAGTLYRVRLQPEAVGWAGEQLDVTTPGWIPEDGSFLLEFTVAVDDDDATTTGADTDTTGGEPPPAPDVPAPTLTDLFAPGQVFAADNPACSCHREPGLARERLDLSSPAAAFAGLVLPTETRSTGFPMVSPERPSESYLVQTLLRDGDGTALLGVLGDPMPPDEPLDHAGMTALALWIEGGALP